VRTHRFPRIRLAIASPLRHPEAVLLVTVWVVVFGLILQHPYRVNHDVSENLYMGRAILDGQVPYVDFTVTNAPLAIYLNILPALVERLAHVHVVLAAQLLTWGLMIWSTLTIRRVLSIAFTDRSLLATAVPLAVALYSLDLMAENSFGQREHLFMLLFLPGFFARWARYQGHALPRRFAVWLGITAAVGALIKPYFLFVALAPELYWLAVTRRLRHVKTPEVAAFTAVGVIYAAHFLVVPTAMREAFFSRAIPLLVGGYSVFNLPLSNLLQRTWTIELTLAGVAALLAYRRNAHLEASLLPPLGAMTLVGVGIFLWQQKGWIYHLIPAYFGAVLILTAGVLTPTSLLPASRRDDPAWEMARSPQRNLFLAACLLFIVLPAREVYRYQASSSPIEQLVKANTAEGDAVLVVDSHVQSMFPMLTDLNRWSGSRYEWAFPIPMIYEGVSLDASGVPDYQSRAETPENRRFLDELAEDVAQRQPKLIFIRQDRCYACPPNFNILTYLSEMNFIGRAMPNYRRLDDRMQGGGTFAVFQLEEPLPADPGDPVFFADSFKLLAWQLHGDTPAGACRSLILYTWWQKLKPVEVNYSMTFALVGSAGGMTHNDSPLAYSNTIQWQAGDTYSDRRSLTIPCGLKKGEYQLVAVVYDSQTSAILPVTDAQGRARGDSLVVSTFEVK
jgi:hypothetical protein